MDDNTGRTPHPEQPAEGSPTNDTAVHGQGADERDGGAQGAAQGGAIQGDNAHGESPRGAIQGEAADGDPQGASQGGAIQGDSSHGESPHGAIQGDANPERDAPLGGDDTTAAQLDADNDVERDTLRTLDPENPPA